MSLPRYAAARPGALSAAPCPPAAAGHLVVLLAVLLAVGCAIGSQYGVKNLVDVLALRHPSDAPALGRGGAAARPRRRR